MAKLRDTQANHVGFTTSAVSQLILPRNPRRVAIWLGGSNATRGSYSFGGPQPLDAGVYANSLSNGTWVTRELIGQVITQELWHIAGGATSCGVLEISECLCEDDEDI